MIRSKLRFGRWLVCGLIVMGLPRVGVSAEPAPANQDQTQIRAAVVKGISLIEMSSQQYLKKRQCFSCHHQAMPMVMLSEARRRGFEIDRENFADQLQRTIKHLKGGQKQYAEGKGQGGRVDTAAWALWALESGDHQPDETTAAVAHFLATYQKQNGHWNPPGNRPPTGASRFASTYVALRGLEHFGTEAEQEQIADRREQASQWLETAEPNDTEDRVYRLRILNYLGAEEKRQAAAEALLERQRDDGGWGQTDDMESDAYATGTVLVALHEAGGLKATDRRYQRGLKFLLDTQRLDGSWKVVSRSKPFQTYFESGFPHKKDQFVSIAASSWAVTAMLFTFPKAELSEK